MSTSTEYFFNKNMTKDPGPPSPKQLILKNKPTDWSVVFIVVLFILLIILILIGLWMNYQKMNQLYTQTTNGIDSIIQQLKNIENNNKTVIMSENFDEEDEDDDDLEKSSLLSFSTTTSS